MLITLENVIRYVEDARDGFIKTDKYFFEDLIKYLEIQPEHQITISMLRDELHCAEEESSDERAVAREAKKNLEASQKELAELKKKYDEQSDELDYVLEKNRELNSQVVNLQNEFCALNKELDEAVEEDLKCK